IRVPLCELSILGLSNLLIFEKFYSKKKKREPLLLILKRDFGIVMIHFDCNDYLWGSICIKD
uniref:hypothetical protein n=1 Tax=Klebsiella pneumoniae TaxID=573 RepID=UPI0024DE136C